MLCKLSYFVYVIIVTVSDKTVHSSLLKERKSFSDKIIRIIITTNNLLIFLLYIILIPTRHNIKVF